MILSKKERLKPILESTQGIHLSIYVENLKGIESLRSEIRSLAVVARDHLAPVMSSKNVDLFLKPILALSADTKLLPKITGSLGLLRTETSFNVFNLPMAVDTTCIVATTFHVKPLLRWLQTDQDFFILGLENDAAHLYRGSLQSFQKLDSIHFSSESTEREEKIFDWIQTYLVDRDVRIFTAGSPNYHSKINEKLIDLTDETIPLSPFFSVHSLEILRAGARSMIRQEVRQLIGDSLVEYQLAEAISLGKRNLFQIARAAVAGRVRKLIISDESRIFGKLDRGSGQLAIHAYDKDHEDDDILDDIAQEVITQGGEVVIVKQNELPTSDPALAIVDPPKTEARCFFPKHIAPSEINQRRIS